MADTDFNRSYRAHVDALCAKLGQDAAMQAAVGGDYVPMGQLEFHLLRSLGLTDEHFVIDVGCGSGRLSSQLALLPRLRYLGTDVIPELLDYAMKMANRPDWTFVHTGGTTIPAGDATADFACFFSVFTHLVHEDTYRYLQEAKRVLKPGGKIVFSFLEFAIPSHWAVFEHTLAHAGAGQHLNQFMDRTAIAVWADYLGLDVLSIADGDKGHIPIPEPVTLASGTVLTALGYLGQSVAVLARRAA